MSVEAEEPRRRFSDTLNPIMHFDNDELDAMGAEIEGELSSSEDSDEEACRDKELRESHSILSPCEISCNMSFFFVIFFLVKVRKTIY